MAQQFVTRPCKPHAEICHVAPRTWHVRGAPYELVTGQPCWVNLGDCWTERGAERRARRWLRKVTRAQQWEADRREIFG